MKKVTAFDWIQKKKSHIYEGGTHLRISFQAFIDETEK